MIPDPIREGLARGWKVHDGAALTRDQTIETDVVVVGTGAGGGTAADILSAAGLSVVMLEEGGLYSSTDFDLSETTAYPRLYQELGARRTLDKAITILQGRCVGGSTTVNWTTSLRTPPRTLQAWRERFGLADYDETTLAPWFEQAEQAMGIAPWPVEPNRNNALLAQGADRLGIAVSHMPRNVRGCWNLGYCGMGCPTNAKQSTLIARLPKALDRGASLWHRMRVSRLLWRGDRVEMVEALALGANGMDPTGHMLRIRARHVVLAGGAINTPGLLLRSQAPDPHYRLGKRTFLHPVAISAAIFPNKVDPYHGAPQSVYSDHFLSDDLDGPIGFKIEVPPVHPVLAATTLPGFGPRHRSLLRQLPHWQVNLGLLRDGFHPESPGGQVRLRSDGSPVLDYPLTDYLFAGFRRALQVMGEIQFAAGARAVVPLHQDASPVRRAIDLPKALDALPMKALRLGVVSAHVMGGCGMAGQARFGVTDPWGRHWQLSNLSVFDGSLFPTSIGANPQLSIYGVVSRLASQLARSLVPS